MISPRMLLPGLLQKAQAQWNRGDIGFLRPSDVCRVPLGLTADPGAGRAKSSTQRLRAKGVKGAQVTSVNMHRLGESFVEKVSDVRRRVTVDGKAAASGESLGFLALIRGCGRRFEGRDGSNCCYY
jgi:hypothetical protein